MIYSLRGTLIEKAPGSAVIECAGVGYRCTTTLLTTSELPSVGDETRLFTHLSVREDNVELFGFYSREEQKMFRLLIGVSGIGPKAAINVLSSMSPSKLSLCIAAGDYKSLTMCQGIGTKTAQRIVRELKDKITDSQIIGGKEIKAPDISEHTQAGEAVTALEALGYSRSEAASAVARFDPSLSTQELIKQALKSLMR